MRGARDWLPAATTFPRIEGANVRLRPVTPADREAVFRVFSDPVVMRYWSLPRMRELREADEYIAQVAELFERREMLNWAIAQRDGDALVGSCTLHRIVPEQRRCEVGFALASQWWGRGWALEATSLAIRFAFDQLGLERFEADIDPRNAAWIRLVERLCFQREGLLRERWRVAGEVQDSAIYGLLRAEFNAPRAPA